MRAKCLNSFSVASSWASISPGEALVSLIVPKIPMTTQAPA
jgi:hypothetical protein